jgi:hypothetical protein
MLNGQNIQKTKHVILTNIVSYSYVGIQFVYQMNGLWQSNKGQNTQ